MKVEVQGLSRPRLCWLMFHAVLVAVVAASVLPEYAEEWQFVRTDAARVRTIVGMAAWILAAVAMLAVAIFSLINLLRATPEDSSMGRFHKAIAVEILLALLSGLVLDGGALFSLVVVCSVILNLAMLASPNSLANTPQRKDPTPPAG